MWHEVQNTKKNKNEKYNICIIGEQFCFLFLYTRLYEFKEKKKKK